MLVTHITKKENSTFIIVLMLLNRMVSTPNFHFNKYAKYTFCLLVEQSDPRIVSIADISQ